MSNRKQLITSPSLIDWAPNYHPYERVLADKTFAFSNSDESKIWFKGCYFQAGGRFGHMKSNQEVKWAIEGDEIQIFNKKNRLYRTINYSEFQGMDPNHTVLKSYKTDKSSYALFTQDGKRQLTGDNFSTELGRIDYRGEPDTRNDYNLMSPSYAMPSGRTGKLHLSFEVRVEEVFDFMEDDRFFAIVGHDKPQFTLYDKDIELKTLSMNFENLTSKKWKQIEVTIPVTTDYVTIGPILTQKGQVTFRNMSLVLEQMSRERSKIV